MALDPGLARKWWEENYRDFLDKVAHDNLSLVPKARDLEDLIQDLAVNVWVKAVQRFVPKPGMQVWGQSKAFRQFFSLILGQYLSSLRNRVGEGDVSEEVGDVALQRGEVSTTRPDVQQEVEQLQKEMSDPTDFLLEKRVDLERALSTLPPELKEPLQFVLEHLDRGNTTEVMGEVQDKWGLTQRTLFNELLKHPRFVSYLVEAKKMIRMAHYEACGVCHQPVCTCESTSE